MDADCKLADVFTDASVCICRHACVGHSSVVGQAAVAQAWEHGDGRGGTATQLARSPQQTVLA